MEIRYRILEVNEEEHAILVRFYSDALSEEALSANEQELRDTPHPEDPQTMVPRWFPKLREDGSPWRCRTDYSITLPSPAPTGDALHEFILLRAPAEWLELKAGASNGPRLAHIAQMVGAEKKAAIEEVRALRERTAEPQRPKKLVVAEA